MSDQKITQAEKIQSNNKHNNRSAHDGCERGSTGAQQGRRTSARSARHIADSNRRNQPQKTAALFLICSMNQAAEIKKLFRPNREACAVVYVPLEKEWKNMFTAGIRAVLDEDLTSNITIKAFQQREIGPWGIGVNHLTMKFMREHLDTMWTNLLDKIDDGYQPVVLSIVQLQAHKFKYPNIDFVGCVGMGEVEEKDQGSVLAAAFRETEEECALKFFEHQDQNCALFNLLDNECEEIENCSFVARCVPKEFKVQLKDAAQRKDRKILLSL